MPALQCPTYRCRMSIAISACCAQARRSEYTASEIPYERRDIPGVTRKVTKSILNHSSLYIYVDAETNSALTIKVTTTP